MEQVHELAVVEQASKRTAKAALRYQKQTENINKKIHAVGVITKSVDERLSLISNVDDREFETLTGVIDGQIDLSKQATTLDKQWKDMMAHQLAELEQLREINTSLQTAHQDKVLAITSLHALADKNHDQYIAELTAAEEQLEGINKQISAFDTKEYMAQITILVTAVNDQLAKEKQAHTEQAEKINVRMTELRTTTKALLASVGHYTNVMQTIDAKIKYISDRVELLDDKVSHVGPVVDGITESDIAALFSTINISEPSIQQDDANAETSNDDVSAEQTDVSKNDGLNEVPVGDDDVKRDEPTDSLTPRRAKHGIEDESKVSSKWKFWTK